MTNYLTKESLRAVEDLKVEEIQLDNLDGLTIRVKQLSSADLQRYSVMSSDDKTPVLSDLEKMALFISLALVDAKNQKLFKWDTDRDLLLSKDPATLAKMFAECIRVNNSGRENVSDILGNLQGTPSDDSSLG